jgi:hypothetical protein
MRPRRETDDSAPSSVEFKNKWSYTSTTPNAFLEFAGTLHLHKKSLPILHFFSPGLELLSVFSATEKLLAAKLLAKL